MDDEIKKYIDNKLKKFTGIKCQIYKRITETNDQLILIEREQERLRSLFDTTEIKNRLIGLETMYQATQIGLQNVYNKFEEIKEFKNLSNEIKDMDSLMDKILMKLSYRIQNSDD